MSDPATTILCIHNELDPRSFITRLISLPEAISESDNLIPWRIVNKYYTADVHFRLLDLLALDECSSSPNEDVILYLFAGKPPSSLPASLVRLSSDSRDVSLAIRVNRPDIDIQSLGQDPKAELEEMFDEIGMEFVDESEKPEEDDERPMDVYERIRQTLQTHLWPNMTRFEPPGPSLADADTLSISSSTTDEKADDIPSSFPVTFSTNIPVSNLTIEDRGVTAFPDPDELRAQVLALDFVRGEREEDSMVPDGSKVAQRLELMVRRLEMDMDMDTEWDDDDDLDHEFGPSQDEYTRLDDWLDLNQDEGGDKLPPPENDLETEDVIRDATIPPSGPWVDSHEERENDDHPYTDGDQFEDDFADFQSPPPPLGNLATETMDPTSLLIHLQSVRADLSAIQDEDQRRLRAGREVMELMRSLGLSTGSEDQLGFDDLDLEGRR